MLANRLLFTFALWLALCLHIAFGQQVSGRITGSVTDSSGAAIPGATVNVFLPGGEKPVYSTTTTADGLFQVSGVRVGVYNLLIVSNGFSEFKLSAVQVEPTRATDLQAI